ncbi:MAG: type II toxin-antitoxin system VapC family toxin [Chloroflexi bacterium AL-N15]|nr:type II toxin-antitoxin system VapC family toxin [Chloroflexi bacterium AL-N15]
MRYGEIRSYLEAQGTPIGAIDTLLAAQALSYNLVFVTNPVHEFVRVPGLAVEDWSRPEAGLAITPPSQRHNHKTS